MTEAEWLDATDSMRMLRSIRSRVSRRQELLFSAASCRSLWRWLSDECFRQIDVLEACADDPTRPDVGGEEFEAAFSVPPAGTPMYVQGAFSAVLLAGSGYWRVEPQEETEQETLADPAWISELRHQADLVRDIIPFRPIHLDPRLLTAPVLALAQSAYDERQMPQGTLDNQKLLVLADAVEEAGGRGDVVAHLRNGEAHVRGCWAVDLLLGKS